MRAVQPFVAARRAEGVKTKTINLALAVVRHILNLAASEWLNENSLTWRERPPKIKLLEVTDARKPYPLSWDEQTRLFKELADHLAEHVNTHRRGAVCGPTAGISGAAVSRVRCMLWCTPDMGMSLWGENPL